MKTAFLHVLAAAVLALAMSASADAGQRKQRPVAIEGLMHQAPTARQLRRHKLQLVQKKRRRAVAGERRRMIPPSVALRRALRYSPGSKGLGVRLLNRARPVYAVKLKSGNRVHRVLIDALTGQRIGQ